MPTNRPNDKKQRRILSKSDRDIRKLAKRVDDGIALFDPTWLLTQLNFIEVSTTFTEDAHRRAPDGFVKKFEHIRKIVAKRLLHQSSKGASLDRLFELVDRLYAEMSQNLMIRALVRAEKYPEQEKSIEAWFFTKTRNIFEPPMGSGLQFRQMFLDRFQSVDKSLIKERLSLSCTESIALCDCIRTVFEERITEFAKATLSESQANVVMWEVFLFAGGDLAERSGLPAASVYRFLKGLSYRPGDVHENYRFPIDSSQGALFLETESGRFYLQSAVGLYRDFYHFAWRMVDNAEKSIRDHYHAWRGAVVERNVAHQLSRLFGEEDVFTNLFYPVPDRPSDWAEADILVRAGDALILCEVKGSEHERAADARVGPERLMQRDFETIKKGYAQCARTRLYVHSNAPATFYDKGNGAEVLTVDQAVTRYYYLVVTANSYGCLAGNCGDLLSHKDGPLPVVMSEFELSTFLEKLHSSEDFVRYLGQREELHGFLKTSDELEVAAVFLTQGNLDDLLESKTEADMLILDPAVSFLFNGSAWKRTKDSQAAIESRSLSRVVLSSREAAPS